MIQISAEFQFCAKHKNYILGRTGIMQIRYANQKNLKI